MRAFKIRSLQMGSPEARAFQVCTFPARLLQFGLGCGSSVGTG
jgi:hypothetical protein